MANPYAHFGLTCPSGGTFYICAGNKTEFLGCCTTDPCAEGSGNCPAANLRTASFSLDAASQIPAQSCAGAGGTSSRWFACQTQSADRQPFLGCCDGGADPCATSGCPQGNLVAAELSGVRANRSSFVVDGVSTVSGSGGSNSNATIVNGTGSSTGIESKGLSPAAVAGITIAVTAVAVILMAVLMYRFGWLARGRKEDEYPGPGLKHMSQKLAIESSLWEAIRAREEGRGPSFYSPESVGVETGLRSDSRSSYRSHLKKKSTDMTVPGSTTPRSTRSMQWQTRIPEVSGESQATPELESPHARRHELSVNERAGLGITGILVEPRAMPIMTFPVSPEPDIGGFVYDVAPPAIPAKSAKRRRFDSIRSLKSMKSLRSTKSIRSRTGSKRSTHNQGGVTSSGSRKGKGRATLEPYLRLDYEDATRS